ncbi:DUF5316 domain-containing protein [Bacillus sp. SCS-153A]|uniref:DUF5316 domain-containing protein n=1 Tax=Rossellomorea sedimentorum TaxID=3115294 RepID=UPI003906A6AE
MKYFLIGIMLAAAGTLLSMIIWGMDKAYMISGGIALLFLGVSVVSSGAMVSGDQMRANFATETNDDRLARNRIMFNSALIGLPNLGFAILIYLLLN